MPGEWLSVDEVVANLGVTKERLYNAISSMRRLGALRTTPNPNDYRSVLIFADDLPALRKFLRVDNQTA